MGKIFEMQRIFLPNDVKEYWNYNVTRLTSTMPNTVARTFTCYDDYYCNNGELAKIGHITLGVFGLIMTLIGLVLNIILIPVMSLVGIRSSATYYMITMAISDLCLLFLDLILVVIRFLPNNDESDQLMMYQNFVAYFVPFGYPAKSVCQIVTLSSCTGLLIDRIFFTKNKKKLKKDKIPHAAKTVISIVAFVIVLKLPNFMLLKIVEKYDYYPTFITVTWTLLAKPWIFIFNSVIFLSVTILLICSLVFLLYLSIYKNALTRSQMKYKSEVGLEFRISHRERLYTAIALLIGVLTMVLNIPHLLQYYFLGCYPTERDINDRYKLAIVTLLTEVIELALVVIKPILYLIFAVHLRRALKDMIGLWIRPSRYVKLRVSGGMGKIVDLRSGCSGRKFSRSDTTDTLLKYNNSENKLTDGFCTTHECITTIDALAKRQVEKENKCDTEISQSSLRNNKQIKHKSPISQKRLKVDASKNLGSESDNYNSTSSGICVDSKTSDSTCSISESQPNDPKF